MSRKQFLFGILSIVLSIPFYIIVRLLYTTERMDNFLQHNFILATIILFLVLPALEIGLAIAALKQKDRNKFFAYLSVIVSLPVILFSLYRLVISVYYVGVALWYR